MGLIPSLINWSLFLSVTAAYALLVFDNGAALGMQSANFAPQIRTKAIIYGMLYAAVIKAALTPFADILSGYEVLNLIGGGYLFFAIAKESHPSPMVVTRLSVAVRKTTWTDFWLALDSIIAGAHLAHGSGHGMFYMWAALAATLPITIVVTYLVARGISRFKWAIWVASALIGGIAARLIGSYSGLHDAIIWLQSSSQTEYAVVILGAIVGLTITAIQQVRTPTTA